MAIRFPALSAMAANPGWHGFGSLHAVAREPFWSESDLPFDLAGGGSVLRLEPAPGFTKEALAGSRDELLLVLDCPDAPGWLVPGGLVADWMARNVACAALDDLLLAHPLYTYATKVDRRGRSRIGASRLAHWAPGLPTVAAITAPEWLPRDAEAPKVNRNRVLHVAAVQDLLRQLDDAFGLLEVEVGTRVGPVRSTVPDDDTRQSTFG